MAQLPDGFLDVFGVSALPSTHPGAFVERGGKAIRTTNQQGFLCFGQYKKGYPIMPLQAIFSIQIDNNTKDDANIFILDVCDHHSDRVIGNSVITRKDFEKANEWCLFRFNFTPPSQEANMEFRIYYMGNASVLADKIAVIDPAKVSITEASQIPDIEPVTVPSETTSTTTTQDVETPLRDPWKTKVIGDVKLPGDAKCRGDSFIVTVSGRDIGLHKDEFRYVYQKIEGDGTLIARVVSVMPDDRDLDPKAGPMIRVSLDEGSAFVMMELRPVHGTAFFWRLTQGDRTRDQMEEQNFAPYWLKLEREGNKVRGSVSPDGRTWTSKGRRELPLDREAYWGLAVTSHNDNDLCTAVFDNVTIIQ